jgi:uncharacterized membrane protein YtjA (UPF0391 family)
MLGLALTFFILSLMAALFGFGGMVASSASMAQILFYVFLGLFFLSLVAGLARGGDKAIKRNR